MDSNTITTLFLAVLGVSVTGNCALWFKMGRLEQTIKKMCPFGKCPLFERAVKEAAPDRKEATNE